jgi:predicted transposase YdaD
LQLENQKPKLELQKENIMDSWLPTLITDTPQAGFELAMHLSRLAVKFTQPDAAIREKLRPVYSENADSLTMVSGVVAQHFQTVAAANNYWRK